MAKLSSELKAYGSAFGLALLLIVAAAEALNAVATLYKDHDTVQSLEKRVAKLEGSQGVK